MIFSLKTPDLVHLESQHANAWHAKVDSVHFRAFQYT